MGKWVQVSLSGEDEGIATSYITKKIGICPTNIGNVANFSILKGYILKDQKIDAITVDVGVFQPKIIHADIPLNYLQAQLAEGRKVALKKIVDFYGLQEGLPIEVKITSLIDDEEGSLLAELSLGQVEKYKFWQDALLDKLIVLGSSLGEIEKFLEYANLNRDVIGIEPLGLFEHVLTCKLGTDAAGLIPRLGRNLRSARFIVFNPKKIASFLV